MHTLSTFCRYLEISFREVFDMLAAFSQGVSNIFAFECKDTQ